MAIRFKNKVMQRFWKFSTSFELGIPVMLALMVLTIAGTIIESKYDAYTAGQLIYRSWMMNVSLALLAYNLVIVVVDRWPWQKKHYPFILVHAGIVMIIVGGWVTQKYGLDGSMTLAFNSQSRYVIVPETDLVVYGTFDGSSYRKISDQEVHFFHNPPSEKNPFTIDLSQSGVGVGLIKIVDYAKYGRVNKEVVVSEESQAGSSLKLQLTNAFVKQVETLTQISNTKSASQTLGPLHIHLGEKEPFHNRKNPDKNEVYFLAVDEDTVQYELYNKDETKSFKTGTAKIGDVIKAPWMNLEIRVLDYKPKAKEVWQVVKAEYPTPLTTSAIQVEHNGRKEWVLLNDRLLLFNEDMAYLVGYINRRIDIGFDVKLNKFEVENYQGSSRAKEYSSEVEVLDEDKNPLFKTLISMNEPLKYGGYYFYQASFEQDPVTQEPVSSVLSVNKDPGRSTKYLGSLILSAGIIWLFYQRRQKRTAV